MKKLIYLIFSLVYIFLLSCTLSSSDTEGENTTSDLDEIEFTNVFFPIDLNEQIDFSSITDDDIEDAKKEILDILNLLLDDFKINADNSFDKVLLAIDDMAYIYFRLYYIVEQLMYLYPNDSIVFEAEDAWYDLSDWADTEFNDNETYNIVYNYSLTDEALDLVGSQERLLTIVLQELRNAGANFSGDDHDNYIDLRDDLYEQEAYYEYYISNHSSTLEFTEGELTGVSDTILSYLESDDGTYTYTRDYYPYIINAATNPETRETVYNDFYNVAVNDNIEILKEMLSLRNEIASMYGYENFSDFVLSTTMAGDAETVLAFITTINEQVLVKAHEDIDEIENAFQDALETDEDLEHKDLPIGIANLIINDYNGVVDTSYEYFEYESVLDALINIADTLFDINIERSASPKAWHEDVSLLNVYSGYNSELLGRIYLDLFTREYKDAYGATLNLYETKHVNNTKLVPACIIEMGMEKNLYDEDYILLSFEDVRVLFHELGHALHSALGTNQYYFHSSLFVEWDFVEVPSMFFEYLTYNKNIIKSFAKHYLTGDVITDAIVDNMYNNNYYGPSKYVFMNDSNYWDLMDLSLHSSYNTEGSQGLQEFTQNIGETYLALNYGPETNLYTFSETLAGGGYESRSYVYLWSAVIATDLLSQFTDNILDDTTNGDLLRQYIYEPGASKEASEMVSDFLGRAFTNDAYFEYWGL
ncbi:MAG: M3 family metallopeptidase [Pseudomonadota bacterium]